MPIAMYIPDAGCAKMAQNPGRKDQEGGGSAGDCLPARSRKGSTRRARRSSFLASGICVTILALATATPDRIARGWPGGDMDGADR
jgi:hypothetical protein